MASTLGGFAFLLLLLLRSPADANDLEQCYQSYDKGVFEAGRTCAPSCPFSMQCGDCKPKVAGALPKLGGNQDEEVEGDSCGQMQCIQADDCAKVTMSGRLNNDTQQCIECQIAGCISCINGTRCNECAGSYHVEVKEDGSFHCIWKWTQYLWIFLGFCGVLILWIVGELSYWHCKPITNSESLRAGLRARWRSLARNLDTKNFDMYPMNTQLHFHQRGVEPLGGPGMLIHLNWFIFIMAVACWLIVGAWLFSPTADEAKYLYQPCNHFVAQDADVSPMSLEYDNKRWHKRYIWAAWNYFGVMLMTLIFLLFQQRQISAMYNDHLGSASLHKYCVLLRGFPESAIDKKQVEDFVRMEMKVRQLDPDQLVECSIAYSYDKNDKEKVDKLIDAHLWRRKKDMEQDSESVKKIEQELYIKQKENRGEEDDDDNIDQDYFGEGDEEEAGPFWVRFIGYLLLGTPFDCPWCTSSATKDGHDELDKLKESIANGVDDIDNEIDIKASGTVYAVFNVETVAVAMGAIGPFETKFGSDGSSIPKANYTSFLGIELTSSDDDDEEDEEDGSDEPLTNPRKPHTIQSSKCNVDPEYINWENYNREPKREFVKRCIKVKLSLTALLFVWFIAYGIFVQFAISAKASESLAVNVVGNQVLGLLIGISNCVLALYVGMATNYIGFKHKGNMLVAQLSGTIFLVGINCWCDLFITRKIPITDVAKGANSWMFTVFEDMYALVTPWDSRINPYVTAMQNEILGLMLGYVLIPYLAEPVGTIVAPFFVGVWRIKRDKRISPEEAERIMLPPQVEVVNPSYNDMITTSVVMFYSLWAAPGHYHKRIFFYYLFGAVFLYAQQRYRLLRVHASTFFGPPHSLHKAESLFWGFPTAILMASWFRETFKDKYYGLWAAIYHIIIYCLIVHFVLPTVRDRPKLQTITYKELTDGRKKGGKTNRAWANYLNVNPIYILLQDQPAKRRPNKPGQEVYFRSSEAYLQPGSTFSEHKFDATKWYGQEGRYEERALNPCAWLTHKTTGGRAGLRSRLSRGSTDDEEDREGNDGIRTMRVETRA